MVVTSRHPDSLAAMRRRIVQVEAQGGLDTLPDVLCEPARRRIVEALMIDELSVSDLAAVIDRKVAATSQHLRVLRELGVVERDRRGKAVFYRLCREPSVDRVRAVLSMLADPDAERGDVHDGAVRRAARRG